MKIQYFQTELKGVKKTEKGTLIKGYASTPSLDRHSDIVEPEAFRESINKEYRKNPIILFQHKHDEPIGRVVEGGMRIDNDGLYIEALIVDDRIEPKIQAGILGTFSIGYIPKEVEYRDKNGYVLDPDKDWARIWTEEGVTRTIKKLELAEISVVSVPANSDAVFSLAKSVKSFFSDVEQKNILINNEIIMKNKEELKNIETKAEEAENPDETQDSADSAVVGTPADETASEAEGDETNAEDTSEEAESENAEAEDEETEGEKEAEPEAEEKPEESEKGCKIDPKLVNEANLMTALQEAKKLREDKTALEAEIKALKNQLDNTPAKKTLAYSANGIAPKPETEKQEKDEKTEKKGLIEALKASAI